MPSKIEKDAGAIPGVVTPGTPKSLPEPWEGKIKRRTVLNPANLPFYLQNGGMLNLADPAGMPF